MKTLFIKIRIILTVFFLLLLMSPIYSVVYTVTSTADAGVPGDLRWAINQANLSPGNVITFTIPGAGVRTITFTAAPPVITQNTFIDGSAQPGWSAVSGPMIEIKGPGFGNGIFVSGPNGFVMQQLTINGFQDPVRLTNCTNSIIRGCWIGVNNTGTSGSGGFGNNAGIYITGGSFNSIGGNLVSNPEYKNIISNCRGGIEIVSSTDNNIRGCYIAVDRTGNVPIPNQFEAIIIKTASHRNVVGGNIAGDGNIMGQQMGAINQCVVYINVSNNCVVQGNNIGLNASGTAVFSIPVGGIYLDGASNCNIGGTSADGTNVIVTSTGAGGYHAISLKASSNLNTFYNNYISVDRLGKALGTAARWGGRGISLQNSTGNIIGGTAPGQRNIICYTSNSGVLIELGSNNTNVIGNYIGVTADDIAKGCGLPGGNDGVQANGITGLVINNNVISNSGENGIDITGASAGTIIKSNYIGTNISGMTCMSNNGSALKVGE
ncbi:MAG: hypothetical protein K2X86_17095 [Cytophagaceae bacterium]|nr:hypothetical protein [Cytophagaceae bacterium]